MHGGRGKWVILSRLPTYIQPHAAGGCSRRPIFQSPEPTGTACTRKKGKRIGFITSFIMERGVILLTQFLNKQKRKNMAHRDCAVNIEKGYYISWFDFDQTGRKDRSPNRVELTTKAFARIVLLHPVQQFRFNVSRRYHNVEEMVIEQFDSSKPVSFTGLIGSKPDDDTHTQLMGTVSLGTPKPVLLNKSLRSATSSPPTVLLKERAIRRVRP